MAHLVIFKGWFHNVPPHLQHRYINSYYYFQRIERIAPVPAETATDKKEPSRTDKSEDLANCDKVNGSLYMAQYANYSGYLL